MSQKIAMNDFDGLRPRTSGLGKKHEEWRATLRIFVDEHIAPDLDAWSEAGTFPDEIYKKAAKAGLLGFGFSAELGGWTEDVDLYHRIQRNQRESRIVALGGGTEKVLSDLAAR